jgi:hypothetical protein
VGREKKKKVEKGRKEKGYKCSLTWNLGHRLVTFDSCRKVQCYVYRAVAIVKPYKRIILYSSTVQWYAHIVVSELQFFFAFCFLQYRVRTRYYARGRRIGKP